MRYKKERVYDYPVDTVTRLFLENENSPYDMSELDNVTMWKVVKEEDLGDKRVGTKEWCAHAQIPKALQHIVSPKMLTWYEHSVWNRNTQTYSFEIEPFYLKEKITCRGQTAYCAKGNGKSSRIFDMDLQVRIPIFGQMFEGVVMQLLKKNEEQDFILSAKALKKTFG